MSDPTCLWAGCDNPRTIARGLCHRDYMRAKRQGILGQFVAPARICAGCGDEFATGKNGRHAYCSDACRSEKRRRDRAERRASALTRPCAECGEVIGAERRKDALFCSTVCQQAVWYRENDSMLKARAATWKRENRDMAKDSDHRRRVLMRSGEVGPIDYVEVWNRDSGKCWICSGPVDPVLAYPHPMSKSWDHVTPVNRGGAHNMANIALSHLRCNIVKKDNVMDRKPAWAS